MGIEDAGTITWLLKELCTDHHTGRLNYKEYYKAVEIYEKIRIPRTGEILDCSKQIGSLEELREDKRAREELELMIQGDLAMYGTLPIMFQGSAHNYKEAVIKEIKDYDRRCEKEAMGKLHEAMMETSQEEEEELRLKEEEETRRAYEILLYGGKIDEVQ